MPCGVGNEYGAYELEDKHEPIMSWAVKSYVGWKMPGPVKGRIVMAWLDTVYK